MLRPVKISWHINGNEAILFTGSLYDLKKIN